MATQIPSADAVREKLSALEHGQMQQLARDSGVPLSTLSNIRNSGKQGPTVDTLRKFWPHLLKLSRTTSAPKILTQQQQQPQPKLDESIDNSSK